MHWDFTKSLDRRGKSGSKNGEGGHRFELKLITELKEFSVAFSGENSPQNIYIDMFKIKKHSSWWLNHPFEKYDHQIGNLPQVGVKIKEFLKPPPSYLVDRFWEILSSGDKTSHVQKTWVSYLPCDFEDSGVPNSSFTIGKYEPSLATIMAPRRTHRVAKVHQK